MLLLASSLESASANRISMAGIAAASAKSLAQSRFQPAFTALISSSRFQIKCRENGQGRPD
jgi:hypothetical protein